MLDGIEFLPLHDGPGMLIKAVAAVALMMAVGVLVVDMAVIATVASTRRVATPAPGRVAVVWTRLAPVVFLYYTRRVGIERVSIGCRLASTARIGIPVIRLCAHGCRLMGV